MAVYDFTKGGNPSIVKIKEDVEASDISASVVRIYDANRTVDSETKVCDSCAFKVEMSDTLTSEEETDLETIIDDSLDKYTTYKKGKWFFDQVAALQDADQKARLIAALDTVGFVALLDGYDFSTAKTTIDNFVVSEDITQADCDWAKGIIPDSKWRTE